MEGQNGELESYELKYQRVSGPGGGDQGLEVKQLPIPAHQGQTVIDGLEKWSWYNITMAASTAAGTGPSSPPVICRTDEDGRCANTHFIYMFILWTRHSDNNNKWIAQLNNLWP